ncbi:CPBP family intramembrane glutamic endopeptidase [Ornithinimicrobium kibberense]|uniref:CPBP family intramembrane glutamic endopeptidase n=1 Tax=Ornithinimicrobium kibberense TaxID=282060 RepID=A0ABV5V2F1_9MICO|nr:type II CAAX endopeptidase family protein [Ornithinimicrobium kibberense]
MNPVREVVDELRDFVEAALVKPVPGRSEDPPEVVRRRRVVVVLTLAVGAVLLWWSLSLPPGDPTFYYGTAVLAVVWAGGAFASGPLRRGRANTREGTRYVVPVVQPIALGLLLLAFFLAGALLVSRVPLLAEPVEGLLDHARAGVLWVVLVITVFNGVAEELFFRGALYAALPRHWAVVGNVVVYAVVTVAVGVPLLVLAAVLIGVVCSLQRRVTGGVLAPIITHITWSAGMLLLLPPLMSLLR